VGIKNRYWQPADQFEMTSDLSGLKATLRAEVRAKLAALSIEARAAASARLCDRLRESETWRNAKSILLFAPLAEEPDVWPLAEAVLAEKKVLALPRFTPATAVYVAALVRDLTRDIVVGRFQIREPAEACPELPLAGLELVLVPGVAFDLSGHRLGRGRGFYDRLLGGIRGAKCGVAFDEQISDEVPSAAHDVRMDFILTPTRWAKAE
jgi:5-formyltetrahydrofolate cyclo-ligase